jgi:hypothetical protein
MAINRQRYASKGLPRQSENPAVASLHPFRNMMKKLRTTYSLGNKDDREEDETNRAGAPTKGGPSTVKAKGDFRPPFCARWPTAVGMAPGQTCGSIPLVAQRKTAHKAPWTKEDVRELKAHSKVRTPLPVIAKKMKRTERALRRKAGILGIGLGHRR